MPGRVGDSPIIGAGTYANNASVAVSGTGFGEQFIKHHVAANISAAMMYGNKSLRESVEVVFNNLNQGDGGCICVDKEGNFLSFFNTTGMLRGEANSDGRQFVAIW